MDRKKNEKQTYAVRDRSRGFRHEVTHVDRFISEGIRWLEDAGDSMTEVRSVLKEIKRHCDDMLIYSVETATIVKAKEIIRIIDVLYCKNVNDSFCSEDSVETIDDKVDDNKENKNDQ